MKVCVCRRGHISPFISRSVKVCACLRGHSRLSASHSVSRICFMLRIRLLVGRAGLLAWMGTGGVGWAFVRRIGISAIRESAIRYQTGRERNPGRGNGWGRQNASRLLVVGALMAEKIDDLEVAFAVDLVAVDEPTRGKVGKKRVHIAIIGGQHVPFDLNGSVV